MSEEQISYKEGENGRIATFLHQGFILALYPDKPGENSPPIGYKVVVCKEKDGDPDFSKIFAEDRVDGKPSDVEELAEMYVNRFLFRETEYMARLRKGEQINDFFQDTTDANTEGMNNISERLRGESGK